MVAFDSWYFVGVELSCCFVLGCGCEGLSIFFVGELVFIILWSSSSSSSTHVFGFSETLALLYWPARVWWTAVVAITVRADRSTTHTYREEKSVCFTSKMQLPTRQVVNFELFRKVRHSSLSLKKRQKRSSYSWLALHFSITSPSPTPIASTIAWMLVGLGWWLWPGIACKLKERRLVY